MLTFLYIFSIIFTVSAVLQSLTLTISPLMPLNSIAQISVNSGVKPPTTFGVFSIRYSLFPGSTLSGEYANPKSSITFRLLLFSRIGHK